jgi:glycerate 2-kinase
MTDGRLATESAWTIDGIRTILRQIFDAGVASANPATAVLRHLPEKPTGAAS